MSAIIYGVFGENSERFRPRLELMARFLSDDGRLRVDEQASPFAIIGRARAATDIDSTPNAVHHREHVAVSGFLHDRTNSQRDEEMIVRGAYAKMGDKFASELGAPFAIAICDESRRTCMLVNDAFGFQPCFYCISDGCVFFASEAEALVDSGQVEPSLDHDGIAELFIVGHPIGGRTLLKGISRLEPASSVLWQDGRIAVVSSQLPSRSIIAGETAEEWHRDIDAILLRSVKSCVEIVAAKNQKLHVALSGGLDSRLLLSHLLRCGAKFTAFTSLDPGATHSDEIAYTKMLAQRFGFEHILYERKPGRPTSMSVMIEGPNWDFIKMPEISGYAGEVLKGVYHGQVRAKDRQSGEAALRRIFTEEFIRTLSSDPTDTALEAIDAVEHPCPQRRREIFHLRHLGSFFRMEQPPSHRPKHLFLNDSHYPFLTRELIDYVTDIPMDKLHKKRFFIEHCLKMHPDVCAVPSTTTDRMNAGVKEHYDARKTLNQQQYMQYLDLFREFSPLWQQGIFTGTFDDKDEKILACIFNVWHDQYFGHRESIDDMKECENKWLRAAVGEGRPGTR